MAARTMSATPIILLFTFLFLIDLYIFKGLKVLVGDMQNDVLRKAILTTHWLVFVFMAGATLTIIANAPGGNDYRFYKYYYYLFGIGILFYFPKIVFGLFILSDDLILLARNIVAYFTPAVPEGSGENVSRLKFIYQLGAGMASLPFIGAAYGMIKGRFDFGVKNVEVVLPNLPASFEGLTMVQLSDLHLGSFFDDKRSVSAGLKMVKDLSPDVLVVTGDWVNNVSAEAENWISEFRALPAKIAKLGIVGNHDYGDYSKWDSEQQKAQNFARLIDIQREMGFKPLMNQNHIIEKNGEKIAVVGVENWGVKPFPQHGDLDRAKQGTEGIPVKILLSHDPSHFEEVVTKGHPDIDLTLSGHTHGMQFGVELGNIKWSPVKYKYPRWAGMYKKGSQRLYVNRGFGYLGFPGRIGMPPEITQFTFTRG